jgi:hypothetical protein
MSFRTSISCLLIGVSSVVLGSATVKADSLEYDWAGSAGVYAGNTTITAGGAGSTYLKATFTDVGVNKVALTIQANLVSPEDIDHIYFNVAPDSLLTYLTWSNLQHITGISETDDATKAGPVHTFDIKLDSGEGSVNGLTTTQTASLLFTFNGTQPAGTVLNANSFNARTPYCPFYYAAAHVQNTGGNYNDSSWAASGGPITSVPAPNAAWGGLVLLAGLALVQLTRGFPVSAKL